MKTEMIQAMQLYEAEVNYRIDRLDSDLNFLISAHADLIRPNVFN